MSKKLIIAALSVVLLIGGATTALATTDNSKLNEIKDLYNQIFGLQQQIVDKQAEAGVISKEQADIMKKNLEERKQYQDQAIDNGQGYGPYGPGYGCGGGFGYGMRGYGMRGGYGYGAAAPGNPAPSAYSY